MGPFSEGFPTPRRARPKTRYPTGPFPTSERPLEDVVLNTLRTPEVWVVGAWNGGSFADKDLNASFFRYFFQGSYSYSLSSRHNPTKEPDPPGSHPPSRDGKPRSGRRSLGRSRGSPPILPSSPTRHLWTHTYCSYGTVSGPSTGLK